MKKLFITILLLGFSHVLYSAGCTNIETPVREGSESVEEQGKLIIHCDRSEILDTEPLPLYAEGGSSQISWRCEPDIHGYFQPEMGEQVLFISPDITGDSSVTIIAEDAQGNSDSLLIHIVDEGNPPSSGDIIISEIAWAGTLTSASDEYIEIVNTADRPFYLNNWRIENAAVSGTALVFSGRIEPGSPFLIANYAEGSEKTAISCEIQFTVASLSIRNTTFGPFVLIDSEGTVMDSVGDGGSYTLGINTPEIRSSISRYSWSNTTEWSPESWYTEGQSLNLSDGTLGTPGAMNSDIPFQIGPNEEDALAILTEYAVDPADSIGEDWAEIYITKGGTLKDFILTDLDGEDNPITYGRDIQAAEGDYFLIIWHEYDDAYDFEINGYLIEENRIFIPDNPPTGTKDQIVLLCGSYFLDGLCYYTEGNDFFDNDEQQMRDFGWVGDPILGKYGAKRYVEEDQYQNTMAETSWDREASPTPGSAN